MIKRIFVTLLGAGEKFLIGPHRARGEWSIHVHLSKRVGSKKVITDPILSLKSYGYAKSDINLKEHPFLLAINI